MKMIVERGGGRSRLGLLRTMDGPTEYTRMGDGQNAATIDLIRWTFSVDPSHRDAIEEHLHDLGLEVLVRDEAQFLVLWDEPEGNIDEVIEAIWAIHGEPFEITQEEFHRQNLLLIHHEELDDSAPDADRAVA